jgi:hypothetical protein
VGLIQWPAARENADAVAKFDADPTRLCAAVERARLALRWPRELRFNLVRQFAGTRYSEEGAAKIQPLNMLSLYVDVIARQLSPDAPRAMLSSFNPQAKPIIHAEMEWLNKEIVKTNLTATFERCIVDALFGMGCCYVGIASPADSAQRGWEVQAGEPFAESVDFDDIVFDLHARTWEELSFIGHRVRRPLAAIKEDKSFTRFRKDLTASTDALYNQQGDPKISVIGRTVYQSYEQEFEDHVDLWQIWLPRHNKILTFKAEDNGQCALSEDNHPLREQQYIGPDRALGGYHPLGYGILPGNLMFKAPLQDLADMHQFINVLYRKIIRQCERQKTLLLVAGSADADGTRTILADDGEVIRVDNPERIKEMSFGGPSQLNWGVFVDAIQRFNVLAGNIEAQGGLAPQAPTATESKILNSAASSATQNKQQKTIEFVEEVLTSLAWLHHHHPTKQMKSEYVASASLGISIDRTVTPAQRQQVPWDDLDVRLDVYSLKKSTPDSRAADLQGVVQTIITPMMQALAAQGLNLDLNFFLKKLGEYKDMPDMAELVSIREPPESSGGGAGGGDAPGKPASTTRNYVRQSESQATPAGSDRNLAATLISGKPVGGSNGAMNGAAK